MSTRDGMGPEEIAAAEAEQAEAEHEMSAQGKCPKCGSDQRNRVGDYCVMNPHPFHSAPPAEPRKICSDCEFESAVYAAHDHSTEAQEASPQEAREPHDGWMNAWLYHNMQGKECAHLWNSEVRQMAGDWAVFRLSNCVRLWQKQFAAEHKLRVEAEQELRRATATITELGKAIGKEHDALAAAEARQAPIEKERDDIHGQLLDAEKELRTLSAERKE